MKIACHDKGQRGFTLVEILIAMGIFMVIIMAIYASWSAILKSSQAGARAAAEVQRTRMTVKCVEDALASTVFFTENAPFYSFETDTSTDFAYLSLVSRLPSSFPGSGLFPDQPIRRVAFEVNKTAAGNNELIMMQSSTLQVLSETESPYSITLATNISHFTLEFWDDQAQDWAYEWLETNSVPRMVKVSLGFGGENNTLYNSQQTLQSKTIYLAGTAITKDFQFPDPAGGSQGGSGRQQIGIDANGKPIYRNTGQGGNRTGGGKGPGGNGTGGQRGNGGNGVGGQDGQPTRNFPRPNPTNPRPNTPRLNPRPR